MTKNVARRAYSAEQLLALRHSASDEPAIQIEANAENGAIKGTLEHPLPASPSPTSSPSHAKSIVYIHTFSCK